MQSRLLYCINVFLLRKIAQMLLARLSVSIQIIVSYNFTILPEANNTDWRRTIRKYHHMTRKITNITRKDVKVHDPTSVTKMLLALKTLNHLLHAKMAGAD